MVQLFSEKKQALDSLDTWLKSLPADTKSIQICAFAYTDDYDGYDEKKTKCVKEGDIWWNLSPEDQMELLTDSVTACLQQTSEYLSYPSDTEEELLERKPLEDALIKTFKQLARSFSLVIGAGAENNLETAAIYEEQMERLFEGVLAFENKDLYAMLKTAFARKQNLTDVIEQLQWRLMTKKAAKPKTAVSKPIGKPNVPKAAPTVKPNNTPQQPATAPETKAQ